MKFGILAIVNSFLNNYPYYIFKARNFTMLWSWWIKEYCSCIFQCLRKKIISDNCDAYIDDIIYNNTWKEHILTIQMIIYRLTDACLIINLSKCEFCHARVTFLGHNVEDGLIKPIDVKVKAITEIPVPISIK